MIVYIGCQKNGKNHGQHVAPNGWGHKKVSLYFFKFNIVYFKFSRIFWTHNTNINITIDHT